MKYGKIVIFMVIKLVIEARKISTSPWSILLPLRGTLFFFYVKFHSQKNFFVFRPCSKKNRQLSMKLDQKRLSSTGSSNITDRAIIMFNRKLKRLIDCFSEGY